MRLLKDFESSINSIEDLYEILDKSYTSNNAWIIETTKGLQGATMVAVDEQAANEGVSGIIRASLIATGAKSVICHQPIDIPTLVDKKSPYHWNWSIACHLKPGEISRYVLGECISNPNTQLFKTNVIQELDQASGYKDLSFLPLVFQGLESFLCVDEPNEITRARKFLEENLPDLTWEWSDYDGV